MSTFVSVPADRLLSTLNEICQKITSKGGRFVRVDAPGRETIVEITLPPTEPPRRTEFIALKIYTSVASGAQEARGPGEDAIRITIGSMSTGEFRPVRGSIIVKRTASNSIEDRVGAFLERLTGVLREAYRFGMGVPVCVCGHHMAERESKGKKFWGCTTYPICKNTKNIGRVKP